MTAPTIIRTPKDGSSPYVATSRAAAQDERLSFEARGMLWYLLSKPNDWEIVIGDLGRAGKCGRNRVYRILRELQKYGYLVRERVRDEKLQSVKCNGALCDSFSSALAPAAPAVAEREMQRSAMRRTLIMINTT